MWNDNEQTQSDFFDNLNKSESEEKPKNGYIAIYKTQRIEVYAHSIYQAQQDALEIFNTKTRRKVKAWDISTTLCEQDNKPVIHTPNF